MIISFVIVAALVFGIPLLAVLFASHAGMAICILSFYLVNPIVSVSVGTYAGFDIKKRWYTSLYTGIIFIITAWSLFTIIEPFFLLYSAVYLVFSVIAMFVTRLIITRKK